MSKPRPSASRPALIEHSLQAWATGGNMDPHTLKRRILAWDPEYKILPNVDIPWQVIHAAVTGGLMEQRTRRETAEAERAEIGVAKAREEVIHRTDVSTFIRNTFAPIREDVVSMPGLLAAKCNPGAPEVARAVLVDWCDVFIKRRRESLPTEQFIDRVDAGGRVVGSFKLKD